LRFDVTTPPTRDPWFRALIILLTIIAALYLGQMVWGLAARVGDLLVLFLVAWIISFVLEPTVVGLTRLAWLSRTGAVLLVYLAVLVAMTSAFMVLLPAVADQSALAAQQLPQIVERVSILGSGMTALLAAHGIAVGTYADEVLRPIEAALVANGLSLATGAASIAAQILLIVVLSVYFMLDGPHLGAALLQAVPTQYRDDFLYFTGSLQRSFGGFLRGQFIQSFVYGLGVAIIMATVGLPYVALASVAAGVAMFIPFLGPGLGLIPTVLVVLAADAGRWWVALLPTLVLNIFVVNVIQPKVMAQEIGLHPTVVLAAVLIGARLAGPWGAIFGAPAAAVIATMASFYKLTVTERRARVLSVAGAVEPEPPMRIHELDEEEQRVTAER